MDLVALRQALPAFLWGVFVFVAYLTAQLLCNVFFHPLRNYPGPSLAKFSILWKLLGNLQGRKAHRIHEAHVRYGPVVRVAPNELSFSEPAAVKEIYSSSAFAKEERFYFAKRIFHENHLLSFRDNKAHRQRQKLKIQALLDQLAKAPQPVDVLPWAHWLGFDTIYHLMFDEDPESVREGHPHWIMAAMRSWRPTFIYKELFPPLERLGPYVPGYIGGYFRAVQRWKAFAVDVIRSCRVRGTKTSFLTNALAGEDSALGRPLTDSELAEECMGGMFGGSGTTANTFVYVLWAVLTRPAVQRRLRAELLGAFPDPGVGVPGATECARLPYLQAVISETLRRYPTIIATLPRVAVQDALVAGVRVRKGTVVGVQNYTVHRNEAAFLEPEAFVPERWLDPNGEDLRKAAFNAFSVGQRSCIGINIARMELSKLVAAFFLRFDAEVDPLMTAEGMEMFDQFSASPVGGRLLIRVQERV
ncbi:hypothetical protein INS49_007167 [Diaporthe citri]|uniref:uncharacterized protein n=1 Tax=Diaporthe citri TaxID=83186 RepID=UPI001C8081A7|nr:uncharacterized protein INS49_007167 [Diaporthe citri]KAG6365556.1 hypothetical protein INS49_007167 [Diaporthe citri]